MLCGEAESRAILEARLDGTMSRTRRKAGNAELRKAWVARETARRGTMAIVPTGIGMVRKLVAPTTDGPRRCDAVKPGDQSR